VITFILVSTLALPVIAGLSVAIYAADL